MLFTRTPGISMDHFQNPWYKQSHGELQSITSKRWKFYKATWLDLMIA